MTTTSTTAAAGGPVSFFSAGQLIVRQISSADRRGCAHPVGLEFRYDPADPHAITLRVDITFYGADRAPEFRFAREMLDHGRVEPVGVGAVRVAPKAGHWVEITLRVPDADCTMLLSVERVDIEAALEVTEQLVPLAAEKYLRPDPAVVDAELAAILAEGTR